MPLVEAGVPTQRIDGGFEFSGWFNSESERSPFHPERWRWFEEDEYVLSYESRLPGYVVEDRVSWARWLPPARETLTLHHRAD